MSSARRQPPTIPVRRNIAPLSASLAANSAMLQLTAAVAAISLARVLDVGGLLGLGPASVLTTGALAAVPEMAVIPALWILHHGVSRRSRSGVDASQRHASTSSPLPRVRPEHAAVLAGDDPRS